MNRRQLACIGATLIGCLGLKTRRAGASLSVGDAPPVDPKPRPHLELILPAESFPLGRPVDFRTIVHNPTPDPLTVWTCGYWPNHLVILVAEDGSEPTLTNDGKWCRLAFLSPNRDKNFPTRIAPGRSHPDGTRRLTAGYLLTPGEYELKVLYSDDQGDTLGGVQFRSEVSLLSNAVKFRVTAPAGKP